MLNGFPYLPLLHNVYVSGAGQIPQAVPVPTTNITNTTVPFAGSAISRQARRLYVGNIPFGVTEVNILFLNRVVSRQTM